MARRPRSPFRVAVHPFEKATRFVTFGPEHPVWLLGFEGWSGAVAALQEARGAFVRLRPPSDVADDVLKAVREGLGAYALALREQPRARAPVVVQATEPRGSVRSAREVVLEIAGEARSLDRPALLKLCEEILAEAGL